jgi:signal transduction histidine kinase
VIRLGLLLVAALGVAAAASFFLARALVRPIRALQEGAARIGAGELEQRIGVKTGDELEALAEQFNKMGSDLQASYAGLERKVEERTAELTQSLEQQTATAEVLQVISRSPTDVQPVFDIISERAMRLCDAGYGFVFTFDGEWIEVAGACGLDPVRLASFRGVFPMRPDARAVVARTIREGVVINAPDVLADVNYPLRDTAERAGFKSALGVPMRREGQIVGAITVARNQTGRFPDKQVRLLETFADQAVIAIANVRLFNETKTALDRQTATSEILQVIGSSVADTAPVFEKILDSCQHLFATEQLGIFVTRDDALLHIAAWRGSALEAVIGTFPKPLDQTAGGLAIRERRTVHYASVDGMPDIPPALREVAQRIGDFSVACAPMLWKDSGVGTIAVQRQPPRPFSADELALLKTFADQAAIAIQNARLFNETQEALERQTATAEILKVISESPTDVQPVFEAIVRSGVHLFSGAAVAVCQPVDGQVQLRAIAEDDSGLGARWRERFPFPLTRDYMHGAAILSGRVLDVPDVRALEGQFEVGKRNFAASGYRAITIAPMLRGASAIGAISVIRTQNGPLSDKQLNLLQTFADQAVIAIENVRLFNETKEALEQQTAISDILRAISESPAEVKPVLDAIADRAARLCDAASASIYLTEGDQLRHVASQGRLADQSASIDLLPINRHSTSGRAVLERTTIQVADLMAEADQYPIGQEIARRFGHRSLVVTPLFREGQSFGTILLRRQEVRPFSEREVALLRTFGDQAAIALENTRLFHEIQDKSRQLEAANRHKSEFLANMSHELRTPLNAIIGFSEVLTEQMFGELNDKQMEYLRDIHSSGQHLLTLINDVLDLSKIEAGKMELDLSCFDLGLLLEHSTTLVRERAQRHGLTLTLEVGDGLGEWVGDARKLKQAVINLLSNAVKFTRAGGRVTLRARHLNGYSGHAGDWAEVSVSDTGIGIKPEDQALVFEEFRQASGDVLRKSEGTGLGLALVKRFAELHGGQVVLTSAPGQGSTFTITLPQHELKVLQ